MAGRRGRHRTPGSHLLAGLAGEGRFVLSFVPHAGFTRSGVVRGNVMTFQQDGQTYEIRFMQPVAGAGKVWNLFVLHDRTYQAKPNQRGMAQSGTDRLENLLPSH